MEVVAIEHINKFKPSTVPMKQFHPNVSDESYQGDGTTATQF